MNRLKLVPNKRIKSGFVDYEIFEDGTVKYSCECKLKLGWFTKTFKHASQYNVGLAGVRSSSYNDLNENRTIDGFYSKVTSVYYNDQGDDSASKVELSFQRYDLYGSCAVNISENLISFIKINLKITVAGLRLEFNAFKE